MFILYSVSFDLSREFCNFLIKNLHFVNFDKILAQICRYCLKIHKSALKAVHFQIKQSAQEHFGGISYLFLEWDILRKFAENTPVNLQKGDDSMSKEAQGYIKGAAAAVVTGGIAFLAVKSLSNNRRFKRKATAKAFKVLGNFMDSL